MAIELLNLQTVIDNMFIPAKTWANLNGAPVDRQSDGTYDVNGNKILSCILMRDGKLQFSAYTDLSEQLYFADMCSRPMLYDKVYKDGPKLTRSQMLQSQNASTILLSEIQCQQQTYKGNLSCFHTGREPVEVSSSTADAYKLYCQTHGCILLI